MKWTIHGSLLLLISATGILFSQLPDREAMAVMPFLSKPAAECGGCHPSPGPDPSKDFLARACSFFCLKCHKNVVEGHHSVGSLIDARLPAVLRLNSKGQTACITCHDLTRPRFDSEPWKSTSLFSGMFRRSARHNTYFLVQKNNSGQLCRSCH